MESFMGLALNLGCGKRPDGRGFIPKGLDIINHDRDHRFGWIDVAHDLNDHPWPWSDEEFNFVLAFDVIEHLWEPVEFMDECWRILKPGKAMIVHTNNVEFPEQAWRDPTHKRVYSIDSFDFFDPETQRGDEYLLSGRTWKVKQKIRTGFELMFILKKRAGLYEFEQVSYVS